MSNNIPLLHALLNFLCPGLGYLKGGRKLTAGLAFGSVFLFLLIGLALGGRFFSLFDRDEGMLAVIFGLCDLGAGGVYLLLTSLGVATSDRSFLATSEYGNVFLMTGGLINYLQVLDVYDAEAGRK
jgi:hypothetical protein